jgi:hypothetical protein
MLLPFPLDLRSIPFIYDDSLSVDFACIPLSDLFRKNMMANGVVPIRAEYYSGYESAKCISYWILGLPQEVSRELNNTTEDCTELLRSLAVVMVPIEATNLDESKLPPEMLDKEARRVLPNFMGEITVEPAFDIKGMSGGPTFGLISQDDRPMTYSLVAIQSSWHARTRTTFGCPWSVFKDLIGMSRKEMLEWAGRARQA